ncbi:pilin [Actinorugispora endophytica]|uniref:TrbC/VIRB2 family protein n=1 Tax=Actinorugispora endophytica TaxID=1605990 RepID=A0A4R6V307_9ACTN|nr:pilin [Actinorugispora endophytica]TDQ54383.1 hypothetical protein EV190_102217 [Actinorugispora endophytica]
MTRNDDSAPPSSMGGPRSRLPAALLLAGAVLVLAGVGADPVWAGEADPAAPASTEDLIAVVDRIREVIITLSASVATLLLTVGGVRWLMAGGDPGEVDKAKRALTGAAIGYGIALLATVLMGILNYIVSGTVDA